MSLLQPANTVLRITLLLGLVIFLLHPTTSTQAQGVLGVVFYQHAFFGSGGWTYAIAGPGYYNLPYTDASSVWVGSGWSVCLFTGYNQTGSMACLTASVGFLGFINGVFFNDNVRSVIVYDRMIPGGSPWCYLLTKLANPVTGGSINSSPAPNCNAVVQGSGRYVEGTIVSLGAVPNSGYVFSNWSGDVAGMSNPVNMTMTGNKSVTANFYSLPDTTITTSPPDPSNDPTPIFNFSGTDYSGTGIAGFECQLDSGGFSACTSGTPFGSLADGTHTFDVRALDNQGNRDSTPASYSWTINTISPIVTINQAAGQTDPTNQTPIRFDVLFSESVTGFDGSDVSINGITGVPVLINILGSGNAYTVEVSGMSSGETVMATVRANAAQDSSGNPSLASTSTDNRVTYDAAGILIVSNGITGMPGIITMQNDDVYTNSFNQLAITYNEDAQNPAGNTDPDDVTNAQNYLLIQSGRNSLYDTVSCADGLQGDDLSIPVGPVTYDNNGGAGPFTATVGLNNGNILQNGEYRLFVCGTTSIVDLVGNPLNDGVDTVLTFTISRLMVLPETGFPRGKMSQLPVQPIGKAYTKTDLILEFPTLGSSLSIVGVPQSENSWDVSWLGTNAGWLAGSAFPTWSGNSVLTGHVWDSFNQPGPFHDIKRLKYDDRILLHAFGYTYVFRVRENLLVPANDKKSVFQHKESPWLTLVTCEAYNEINESYIYRRVIRAVLVSVQ